MIVGHITLKNSPKVEKTRIMAGVKISKIYSSTHCKGLKRKDGEFIAKGQ